MKSATSHAFAPGLMVVMTTCALCACDFSVSDSHEADVGRVELPLRAQAVASTYGLAGTIVLDDPDRLTATFDELELVESVTLEVRVGDHQLELCADGSGNPACAGTTGWSLYELTCDAGTTSSGIECFDDPGAIVTSTPVSGAVLSSPNPQPVTISARQTTRAVLEFEVPGRGTVTFGHGTLEITAAVQEGLSDGRECAAPSDCISRVCSDEDQDGIPTCQPATCTDGVLNGDELEIDCGNSCGPCPAPRPCADTDLACITDSDCCSLSCDQGLCTTGLACAVQGETCNVAEDCCSLTCVAGTCADGPAACDPVGETCSADADCCSDYCIDSTGEPCAVGSACRCAFGSECRAQDEVCTDDTQCCTSLCDRPDSALIGRCASVGGCDPVGEPCAAEGVDAGCCSLVCADASGSGTLTCQALSGCSPVNELCSADTECCSGTCSAVSTTTDGRPILRCVNTQSCLSVGDVCGAGGATSDCCPPGGGSTGCGPAEDGLNRCYGGDSSCTSPSDACISSNECCSDASLAMTCGPDVTGQNVCCIPQGEECAFDALCCSGVCTSDSAGTPRCQ